MESRWDIMRTEAYGHVGRQNARKIILLDAARRWALPVIGALALGGRWVWLKVSAMDMTPAVHSSPLGAVPWWLWLTAAVLAVAVGVLFRPGRLVMPSEQRFRLLPLAVFVLAVLAILGVILGAS